MDNLIPLTNKQALTTHLAETQILSQSFQLYGSKSGYQDYGIVGNKIKQNIINAWRQILVKSQNGINEVTTPIVTPYDILKASGHLDRFTDLAITDRFNVTHRADHLVEDFMKNNSELFHNSTVNLADAQELESIIKKYKLIDADDLSIVLPRSLMIKADDDYLRPEIAQGIFVNFKQYLDYFSGKLPFGIAQTGKSYRKEITCHMFTRLREFTQAEIEYFFDPLNNHHPYFNDICNIEIPLLTAENQLSTGENKNVIIHTSIIDAVEQGLICNEIMGYFLGKIFEFCKYIGINNFRFRQHLPDEKAHYSMECWDLECYIPCEDKWLETIGVAHRGDYDLKAHNKFNKNNQAVMKRETFTMVPHKKINLKKTKEFVSDLDIKRIHIMMKYDDSESTVEDIIQEYNLPEACVTFVETKVFDTFIPHVIEPSFGIDRLCYAVLSQNIYYRKQSPTRLVLLLNRNICPFDLSVFSLSNSEQFSEYINKVVSYLENKKNTKIKIYTDNSSVNIGKRYIRSDEIGIKYAITIDFQTLQDDTVTVRDNASMEQIRKKYTEIDLYS